MPHRPQVGGELFIPAWPCRLAMPVRSQHQRFHCSVALRLSAPVAIVDRDGVAVADCKGQTIEHTLCNADWIPCCHAALPKTTVGADRQAAAMGLFFSMLGVANGGSVLPCSLPETSRSPIGERRLVSRAGTRAAYRPSNRCRDRPLLDVPPALSLQRRCALAAIRLKPVRLPCRPAARAGTNRNCG